MSKKVCPRCGRPIDWVERHKVKTGVNSYRYYVLAVHVDKDTKKRRKCYLGPLEGYKVGMFRGNVIHTTFKPQLSLINVYGDGSKTFLLIVKEDMLNGLVDMFNKLASELNIRLVEIPNPKFYKFYCLEKQLELIPTLSTPIAYISVSKHDQILHVYVSTTTSTKEYEEHIIKTLKEYVNQS